MSESLPMSPGIERTIPRRKCSFLRAFVFLFIGFFGAGSSIPAFPEVLSPEKKTYLVITVDTESLLRDDFMLYDQFDTRIKGRACGIEEMMRIADLHGAKITFYFNVYEASRLGADRIGEIARKISERGHDVQLHTHPEFMFDPERLKMYEYSLDEQTRIIEAGKRMIKEWTGAAPVAHRAGTYAANIDTLSALQRNSIYLDSSFRYLYPECRLDDTGFRTNSMTFKDPILEIPVTLFYVGEWTEFLGRSLPPVSRLKKFDIDSCDLDLLTRTLSEFHKSEVNTVTLFMHSWSFVESWSGDPGGSEPDDRDIQDFHDLLGAIRGIEGIVPISTRKLWEKWRSGEIVLEEGDYTPIIPVRVGPVTYLRRYLGVDRGNVLYWLLGLFALSLVPVLFAARVLRK